MNADQFNQMINALRPPPGRKTEKFSSGDGVEWATWRDHFEVVRRINNWNNARARQEIAASVIGSAKMMVQDIDIGDQGVDPHDYTELLDEYEARFLPAAASDAARVEITTTTQDEGETVLAYHSRMRHLYRRAYPALGGHQVEASRQLIDLFIRGLRNQTVSQDTWKARPATYNQALQHATNMQSAYDVYHPQTVTVKTEPGLNSVGDPIPEMQAVG